jgi:hypothetical protein
VLKLLKTVKANVEPAKYVNKVAAMAVALLMSKPDWNLR